MSEISAETSRSLSRLIAEYARLRGRTNTEVAYALLSSRTLRRNGYHHAQRGRLTEKQGRAAIRVLDYWIGEELGSRVSGAEALASALRTIGSAHQSKTG